LAAAVGGNEVCQGHFADWQMMNRIASRFELRYGTGENPPTFPDHRSQSFVNNRAAYVREYEAYPEAIRRWGWGVRYREKAQTAWGWYKDCEKTGRMQ